MVTNPAVAAITPHVSHILFVRCGGVIDQGLDPATQKKIRQFATTSMLLTKEIYVSYSSEFVRLDASCQLRRCSVHV